MPYAERRARFRQVLQGETCVHPGSVFDPISARIASDLGFEVGMFAGSVASLTVLGAPDHIVLTLSEFAQQIRRITRASGIPLMVDADHGYGNALNVMRTVEELCIAGVSGLSIEDTDLPPPFGAAKGQRLLSLEEGVGKMKAAMAAKPDPAMAVFGRTSACAIAGVEEAVRRARAYCEAGVDAIFMVGVSTRAELEAIAAVVDRPLMLGGAPGELADRDYLAAHGVRIALQGHAPIMAAVQATYDTLKALRDGTAPKDLKGVADGALMARVTRAADYDDWMGRFLA
ncbi:MAG: isocitrate lyase/PEP mutase family protein [Ectothiorhodospiraceae bacterium]|nr:isocitrate lyase/PEP mutase family protein [Chromatiales bacterium]MCP5157611.1 isocitrate lyase/PEP mutase family protein [Ectothiorhodospiraceae bacterium]